MSEINPQMPAGYEVFKGIELVKEKGDLKTKAVLEYGAEGDKTIKRITIPDFNVLMGLPEEQGPKPDEETLTDRFKDPVTSRLNTLKEQIAGKEGLSPETEAQFNDLLTALDEELHHNKSEIEDLKAKIDAQKNELKDLTEAINSLTKQLKKENVISTGDAERIQVQATDQPTEPEISVPSPETSPADSQTEFDAGDKVKVKRGDTVESGWTIFSSEAIVKDGEQYVPVEDSNKQVVLIKAGDLRDAQKLEVTPQSPPPSVAEVIEEPITPTTTPPLPSESVVIDRRPRGLLRRKMTDEEWDEYRDRNGVGDRILGALAIGAGALALFGIFHSGHEIEEIENTVNKAPKAANIYIQKSPQGDKLVVNGKSITFNHANLKKFERRLADEDKVRDIKIQNAIKQLQKRMTKQHVHDHGHEMLAIHGNEKGGINGNSYFHPSKDKKAGQTK